MRIVNNDHNYVGQEFVHSYRLSTGAQARVTWQRVLLIPRGDGRIPDEGELPWFVTFRVDNRTVAEYYRPATQEPDPASCRPWEHEVLSAYEEPARPEPRRRGLLWHLVAGARLWFGEGS